MKVSQFLGKKKNNTHLSLTDSPKCLVRKWNTYCVLVAVDGLCTIAGHVGRELAPHVKKHGAKLIPDSMKKDKDGRSNIDGAMVVAASGVQGNIQYTAFYFRYI